HSDVGPDRFPARPPQDVAEDGRKPRPLGGYLLVLERIPLHARQLCELQSWTVYDHAGCGCRTGSAWTSAICRRAYGRRVHGLHERRRAKRKSRRGCADQGYGTAQMSEQPAVAASVDAVDACFPVALGAVLE